MPEELIAKIDKKLNEVKRGLVFGNSLWIIWLEKIKKEIETWRKNDD